MPDIATIRECDFYDFLNLAEPGELEQERQNLQAELDRSPNERSNMLDRMRDRLAVLDKAIAVC